MTEAMKHRLVGAAVLVALGIIVWPVIFDTTPVREISQRSQIPDEPKFERFDVAEPREQPLPPAPDYAQARAESALQPPAGNEASDSGSPEHSAPPDPAPADGSATQPAQATAAPALLDEHELPVQWAVQLGVFGNPENAQEIKRRAEKAGYQAILQTVRSAGSVQHRVYVNPKLDKRASERLALEVEKKLGVKGYVTRYYP